MADPTVGTIQLLRNVSVTTLSARYTSSQPLLRTTNLTIQSVCGSSCTPDSFMTLDLGFLSDLVLLGDNVTLRFRSLALTKYKKVLEVGLELLSGRPGAGVAMSNVLDVKLACPPSTLQVQLLQNAPVLAAAPDMRTTKMLDWFCWHGRCYNGTLHYDRFGTQVAGHTDENSFSEYGADSGYAMRIFNSTRLCNSYWPLECLSHMSADACHSYYIDLALNQNQAQSSTNKAAMIGALVAILGGAVVVGSVIAFFVVRWRQARRRATLATVPEAAKDIESGGTPMNTSSGTPPDRVLNLHGQHRRGWHLLACHTSPAVEGPEATSDDKIELGVLLGAGSSGRVYRARWRNRDVAVKVLQHDARTAAAVANETDLTMGFDHPCIVRAFHVVAWCQQPGSISSAGQARANTSLGTSNTGTKLSASPAIGSDGVEIVVTGPQTPSATPASGGSSNAMKPPKAMVPRSGGSGGTPVQLVPFWQERANGTGDATASAHASPGTACVGSISSGRVDDDDDDDDSFGHLPGLAQTWLVQEYCDGGTLSDAVRAGRFRAPDGFPDMAKVLTKLQNVASGMLYLHARNVLHRDLKASNVLLTSDPLAAFGTVAKVADFGLSAAMNPGETHHSTRTLGTVSHMAPELLTAGRQSPAADVYAFGIVMWEMVSGRSAFSGAHYGEVFQRVAIGGERPPLDAALQSAIGERYMELMRACWATDPAQRPPFAQVCKALEVLLDHHTAATHDGSTYGGCSAGSARDQPLSGSLTRRWSLLNFNAPQPAQQQEQAPVQGFF